MYRDRIGVKTQCQGRGVATRVLGRALQVADAEKRAVTLFTGSTKHVRLYERFGFRTLGPLEGVEMDKFQGQFTFFMVRVPNPRLSMMHVNPSKPTAVADAALRRRPSIMKAEEARDRMKHRRVSDAF